ncbi:MAG: NAD-dependent epimerase/dehydratase family protein [Deltaproteobacteria bacterium]|nr:NAD-dependent epimerase/dehydratase family protein [Deltaproteobacteria bacterium]MBW2361772.1 NAD-dependent epimerase/dehydratase family protein [Deltaproteobacteria bacterium]
MRTLIVGGTGLTGPILVRGLLDRGHEVVVLHSGRHETSEIPPEVEHIHVDVHRQKQLREALAGRKFDVALSMHGRLVEVAAALKGHTGRLISVGGECVYRGWLRIGDPNLFQTMEPSPVPVAEDSPLEERGRDPFVDRMLEAEEYVMRCHTEGHFDVTHFRFTIGYGPRQPGPTEWSVVRRILDGRKRFLLPLGGQVIVSRGYAENCAHGILLAVDQPEASAGEIYNVCDETLLTNRQWVETISRIMEHPFELIDVPGEIAEPGHLCASPPFLNYPFHEVMSLEKIKRHLGYEQVVAPEPALRKTIDWLLANHPEPGSAMEYNIGDRFDYAAEDRLIDSLHALRKALRAERHGTPYQWKHPYPHPARSKS